MSEPIVAERPPRFATWLTRPMLANRSIYVKVALAAAMINLFALVTSLFTMTVYDRVVPNNAYESLVALSIGLLIVLLFDFVLRILRAYFVDLAGADIDREIGGNVFDRMLRVRMESRRGSTGATAGMMRELETLRDFFASATITTLVDVPFIALTLAVIAAIGGVIVWVPLAMIPVVVGASLLTQPALDRLSARAMNGGLHKQSVLVETIGALEMVKVAGAGRLLQRRWLAAVDDQADASLRQRLVGTIATTIATSANTIAYAGVVIVGVFLIAERELTTGGLVACSILAGRAVQPLATIASLLARISATRTAYRQVNTLMGDAPEGPTAEPLRPGRFDGAIELRNVSFQYPGQSERAITDLSLRIRAGERIALIGRIGSGKSSIARLILGLYQPIEGMVLIDGTDIRQYDPQTMRALFGVAVQDSTLLSGSVRENIVLGRDGVDDEEMLRAAKLSGTHQFMGAISNGYDLRLADRGESLSGGQRQSIAIARALAGRPPILVFDEPSSAMDAQTEAGLIQRLQAEVQGRTLVLITHRPSLLALVERIVVMEGGRVADDGPRDQMIQKLTRPRVAA